MTHPAPYSRPPKRPYSATLAVSTPAYVKTAFHSPLLTKYTRPIPTSTQAPTPINTCHHTKTNKPTRPSASNTTTTPPFNASLDCLTRPPSTNSFNILLLVFSCDRYQHPPRKRFRHTTPPTLTSMSSDSPNHPTARADDPHDPFPGPLMLSSAALQIPPPLLSHPSSLLTHFKVSITYQPPRQKKTTPNPIHPRHPFIAPSNKSSLVHDSLLPPYS
jgi:hypothetical protein